MNGLAHCVEGFYSRVRTPVSSALALEAIRMFMQALPAVAREPDSVQARGIALVAAHLSGQVLLNARSCIHHSVCHALGAVAAISHGDANSIMLPHAMAFNAADPDAAAALALCAQAMGASDASPEGAIERVQWLQQAIKVPTRLRDTGMQRSLLTEVAAKVMGEKGLYVNPRRVTQAAQVEPLLLAAW
jgi:alcohol dehydrogenase